MATYAKLSEKTAIDKNVLKKLAQWQVIII